EHQRLLQQPVRRRRPHVDGHIQQFGGDSVVLQTVVPIPLPPVAVVDSDGVLPGEVGNVQFGVAPTADTPFGLPARVPGVVDVAALVFQHHLHGPPKTLVRDSAHIVTVTSLRLPLNRMCAGPSALGRYPLRSAYPPQSSSALPLT